MTTGAGTSKPRDVHFLACVHGMWGTPDHLLSVENTIREKFPKDEKGTELVTLRLQTNAESYTYDGMDWCAERAVKEVRIVHLFWSRLFTIPLSRYTPR
jgi:hypothetical protein